MSEDKRTWFGMNPGDDEAIKAAIAWAMAFELSQGLDELEAIMNDSTVGMSDETRQKFMQQIEKMTGDADPLKDHDEYMQRRLNEVPPHRTTPTKFEWKQPKDRGHRFTLNPYRRPGQTREDWRRIHGLEDDADE